MRIRCDKCSTVYELDDGLLPPQGAPVQCSTCQFVFTAYPPRPARPQAAPPGSTGRRYVSVDEPPAMGEAELPPVEASSGDDVTRSPAARPTHGTVPAHSWLEAPPAANGPQPEPEPEAAPPVERRAPAPAAAKARPVRTEPPIVGPARSMSEREAVERTGEITRGPLAIDPAAESPPRQPARAPARLRSPGAPAPAEPKFTPDGRPIRKVPFPTDESAPTPVARPLPGRGGHPGAHPQGEKAQGQPPQGGMRMTPAPRRPVWVIAAAVVVLLGLLLLSWLLLSRRGETAREGVEGASDAPAPTGRAHGPGEPGLALVPPAGARPKAP